MNELNEIKLAYQPIINHSEQLNTPSDVAAHCRKIVSDQFISEETCVIYLNRNHNPIGFKHLGVGDLTRVIIDLKLVCSMALLTRSSAVVLCHTHPSGNAKASEDDLKLTTSLKKALELFEIKLLDHIILTPGNFVSIAVDHHIL